MDTKGPTLIATSLGLLFSGIVMVQSQKQTETDVAEATSANPAPASEVTRRDTEWNRTTTSGGTLFISSNDE